MHPKYQSKFLSPSELSISRTKKAALFDKLLSEPLLLFYSMAGFILSKSLKGTHAQVALLTMLNPSVGLLILYWNASIHSNSRKLKENLMWSGVLARVPFLFFPWIYNPWLFIVCGAIYIFFYRASNPAWMEILKLNLPAKERGRVYSFASALGYAEGFFISLWVIPWLRHDETAWRYCFPMAALIGMISICVQNWVIPKGFLWLEPEKKDILSLKQKIVGPWKEAFALMSARPDFARFQWGFFLCGFGLMMSSAMIPIYCANFLNISLGEFATAKLFCTSLGFVLASKYWSKKLNQSHIFEFMMYVVTGFILFAIFLMMASFNVHFLYIAFFVYGVAQAGSKLSWGLSGPIFAKNESSTVFSSINVLMVGVRGCVAPLLGGLICAAFSPYLVFTFFILLSFISMWVMIKGLSKQFTKIS